ncbi:DUF4132 domain-containing protein [Actinomadura fibrosa]|uniref:DUF4132 domain-containing protein n=1 Tax=Actinomadura fibrosa TaxID=111802 RepID=A0ABW2XAA5_9ACTN|nr:DUF4132 domain-containing protein [Actinomadura fibrosa]
MADALPGVLTDPPWRVWDAPDPVIVKGLKPPPSKIVWEDGEREKWAPGPGPAPETDWDDAVRQQRDGRLWRSVELFTWGPEDDVRPLLATWKPDIGRSGLGVDAVLARFGLDALAPVLHAAKDSPENAGGTLLPVLDGKAARIVSGWLASGGEDAGIAHAWLTRHGADAVPYLLPDALGARESLRAKAALALRLIAAERSPEAVVDAAGRHAAAVAPLLADVPRVDPGDPWAVALLDPPRIGGWLDPATLPAVALRGGGIVPLEANAHIATMLAMSGDDVFPGLSDVHDACDPPSLAAFAWAIFERWRTGGAPTADAWALTTLGIWGDDDTVRRLTPILRAWPGQAMHHRAVQGLDVLAAMGTETALVHLDGIARKVKFGGLRDAARAKIAQVARHLGLTGEQLADRLVPRFGLDASGTLTLDYGPRRFTVGFDEQLKPYVTDDDGKLRKSLPKPGAKDDPSLAPAAYQRYADLKKDVRAIASVQLGRLEAAMLNGRRWSAADWRDHIAGHPLIWHLARRLVWTSGGTAVRLAEDRTLADVDDKTVTLPDGAEIALPHPIHLGDDLPTWTELFADYEILQPFPQLARPVHAFASDEAASWHLPRFEGAEVPMGRLLALDKHGWERGRPQDNGTQNWLEYRSGSVYVVISLFSGIQVGMPYGRDTDRLTHVWITERPHRFPPKDGTGHTFAELDPVTASEVLAHLTSLTG